MIPILDVEQLRAADAHTMATEPITSMDLMERASQRCVEWFIAKRDILFPHGMVPRVLVLAGPGNNGGDGLAIARLLDQHGWKVRVQPCLFGGTPSPDRSTNLARLEGTGVELLKEPDPALPAPPFVGEIVVDALFGIGLSRPLLGPWERLVSAVNGWRAVVISIDLPSGLLDGDPTANDPGAIVKAQHVLTFQCPKLALLLPDHSALLEGWTVLDIGLDQGFIKGLTAKYVLQEASDLSGALAPRFRHGHKGTYGHALLVAGGPGKMGAAVLAARACTRSGVGLVTAAVPAEWAPVMHSAVPEAMVRVRADSFHIKEMAAYRAIGVGPGMGTGETEARLLKSLIQNTAVPLVLDADAITLLAQNPTWCAFLPSGCILTPHPGEFDRLAGGSRSGFERFMKAVEWSTKHGVWVILKGAYTSVIEPNGSVVFNQYGNSGMAKGGSGDVLTGLLTGLLAQGLGPGTAAKLAVHLHARAGDAAAAALGMDAMHAGDLVDHLPHAFRELRAS